MITRPKPSIWILALTAVLPVLPALADCPAEGNVLTVPYVAVGGPPEGWHFQTVLILGNPQSEEPSCGTIEFLGNDWQPLPVRLNEESELAWQVQWSLSPQRSKLLFLTLPGNNFQAGWLRLKASSKTPIELIVVVQIYNGEYLFWTAGIQVAPGEEMLSSYRRIAYQGGSPARGLRNPSAYPVALSPGPVTALIARKKQVPHPLMRQLAWEQGYGHALLSSDARRCRLGKN